MDGEAPPPPPPVSRQSEGVIGTALLAWLSFLYRLVASIPIASQNLLATLQRYRCRCRDVRGFLGLGNVTADFVVDEFLHDILLASAHDAAADPSIEWLRPEVLRVHRIPPGLKRNQMVFFVAGHVIGMGHAPNGIDLLRAPVDEFRSCLMDGIAVLAQLLPLELARVFPWGPDLLRGPLTIADGFLDVALGDVRVCSAWGHYGVWIKFGWADAAEPGPGPVGQGQEKGEFGLFSGTMRQFSACKIANCIDGF
jgi:hypothetical protein